MFLSNAARFCTEGFRGSGEASSGVKTGQGKPWGTRFCGPAVPLSGGGGKYLSSMGIRLHILPVFFRLLNNSLMRNTWREGDTRLRAL